MKHSVDTTGYQILFYKDTSGSLAGCSLTYLTWLFAILHVSSVQNPCWLMISSRVILSYYPWLGVISYILLYYSLKFDIRYILYTVYIGCHHSPWGNPFLANPYKGWCNRWPVDHAIWLKDAWGRGWRFWTTHKWLKKASYIYEYIWNNPSYVRIIYMTNHLQTEIQSWSLQQVKACNMILHCHLRLASEDRLCMMQLQHLEIEKCHNFLDWSINHWPVFDLWLFEDTWCLLGSPNQNTYESPHFMGFSTSNKWKKD